MSDPPKQRPRLSMDPNRCQHSKLMPLFKYRRFRQTIQRCIVCGRTMTADELREAKAKKPTRTCNMCGRRLRGDRGPAICEDCAEELGRMMNR